MLRRIDQNKELKTIYSIFVKGKKGLPFRKKMLFFGKGLAYKMKVFTHFIVIVTNYREPFLSLKIVIMSIKPL